MKTYYLIFGTTGDPRTFVGLAPTFLTFNNNGSAVTPPSISAVSGATGFYSFTWGTTTPICFLADAATTSPGAVGRYVTGAVDPADRADEYGTTMIAIGTSHIAQGVSILAMGSTALGYGVTGLAVGLAGLGFGFTNFGFGVSIYAGLGNQGVTLINFGTTLVGIGNTLVGIGNTVSGIGVTTSAFGSLLGDTSSSYGSTSIDPSTVFGFLKRTMEVQEGNQVYAKNTGLFDIYSRGSSVLLREKTISDSANQTTKT